MTINVSVLGYLDFPSPGEGGVVLPHPGKREDFLRSVEVGGGLVSRNLDSRGRDAAPESPMSCSVTTYLC